MHLHIRQSLRFSVLSVLIFWNCVSYSTGAESLESSTSSTDRNAAIRAIPFQQLNDESRDKIQRVVSKPDLYRRLPVVTIDCDPDLYLHMVRNPEIVVNMWHLGGITQIDLERVGQFTLDATDGAGTTSRVELVYGTPNIHIYYGRGTYEGPLIRNRISGNCVMVLRSEYLKGKSGESLVRNRLDVFVAVDQRGVGMIAKTLHSVMGHTIDNNFVETVNFLSKVSKTAETDGPAVQELAHNLDMVSTDTREKFGQLAMLTYQRAAYRHSGGKGTQVAVSSAPKPVAKQKPSEFRSISNSSTSDSR